MNIIPLYTITINGQQLPGRLNTEADVFKKCRHLMTPQWMQLINSLQKGSSAYIGEETYVTRVH